MCIIVASPQNSKFPDMEILQTCFKNNPDGAGIMWASNGSVYVEKGFMQWGQFEKFITTMKEKRDLDKLAIVLHFRIATHAGVVAHATHPFPITDEEIMLKSLSFKSDIAVVHNGIISMADIGTKFQMSDTQMFIKDYLSLMEFPRQLETQKGRELIARMIESKMTFLEKDGTITYIGSFTEDNGVYYSNSTYKAYKYTWKDYDDVITRLQKNTWIDYLIPVDVNTMMVETDADGLVEDPSGYYFDEYGLLYYDKNSVYSGAFDKNLEYVGSGGVYNKETYEPVKFDLKKSEKVAREYEAHM